MLTNQLCYMSEGETFGPLLHGTARAWRLKLDERLKPMGLSQGEMAHAAASLAGGDGYTGRGRRAVGHRGAVIGDVVAPPGE